MNKAVATAMKSLAKSIRYSNYRLYEQFYIVYKRDKVAGAAKLKELLIQETEYDITHYGKMNKHYYKMALALYELWDWEQVAEAVVSFSVADEEGTNPNKSYRGYK